MHNPVSVNLAPTFAAMHNHEVLMERCFLLAELGLGHAAPNPLVGSVIVHEGKIIGEGHHKAFGGPHAEVNAVESVADKEMLKASTIYVNLEPCAHHGKTPPCADLIIRHGIPRVVISNVDPFEKVAGAGIQRLRDAGVEVVTGVLEDRGAEVNRRFFTFHRAQRPYTILKWAQTSDGYIDHLRSADSPEKPLKITNEVTNQLVHKWRTQEAAILVGRTTALLDNPQLTVRHWPGKSPLRLLIDPQLELPASRALLSDGLPTWIFNTIKDGVEGSLTYVRINKEENLVHELATKLYQGDIQSVIIEGGAATLQHFIDAGIWDEARVLTGHQRIGSGVAAPQLAATLRSEQTIGTDRIQYFRRS